MRKQLILWEMKKISSVPMFWIFVVLCIGFNSILILSNRYGSGYVAYISGVTREIGGQMGEAFDEDLEELAGGEYRDLLVSAAYGASDIFEDYSAMALAEYYIRTFMVTGVSAELLEHKVERLQACIDSLADSGASLSLAAGGMTQAVYDNLFAALCRAVVAEGILFAVLAALYSSGCEGLYHTTPAVYASRIGRCVQKSKLLASMLGSLAAYIVISGVSTAVFPLSWQPGPIWNSSMSSQF